MLQIVAALLLSYSATAAILAQDDFAYSVGPLIDAPAPAPGWSGTPGGDGPQVTADAGVETGSASGAVAQQAYFDPIVEFVMCFTIEVTSIGASTSKFFSTYTHQDLSFTDAGFGQFGLVDQSFTPAGSLDTGVVYTVVITYNGTDGVVSNTYIDPIDPIEANETPLLQHSQGTGQQNDRCCRIFSTSTGWVWRFDSLVAADTWAEVVGGGIHGDPHFVGFHGQRYDVSGQAGEVYNLITQTNLQFNSRFVACPEDHQEAGPECVVNGEFGIKTIGDELVIDRDGTVTKNGAPVTQADSDEMVAVVTKGDSTFVTVNTEDYVFTVEAVTGQELNLIMIEELREDPESEPAPHGLIGHTHIEEEYPDHEESFRFLEGSLEDYRVKSGSLFGDDFAFNLF